LGNDVFKKKNSELAVS